jgi:hypothetical protein
MTQLVKKVKNSAEYYKLLSVLSMSTRLYPLLIRLEEKGIIENSLKSSPKKSILDLIEIADLRVYKIRGTDPRADMSTLACEAKALSAGEIEDRLIAFINYFMSDSEFERRLYTSVYPNVGLKFIFTTYNEKLIRRSYKYKELIQQSDTKPTIEHIFSIEPKFNFPNNGFDTIEDYNDKVNMIGNLTLLEKSINSQCHNKSPIQKIKDNLYGRSIFKDPKKISAEIKNRGSAFVKNDAEKRSKELVKFCLKRWSI